MSVLLTVVIILSGVWISAPSTDGDIETLTENELQTVADETQFILTLHCKYCRRYSNLVIRFLSQVLHYMKCEFEQQLTIFFFSRTVPS